MNYWGPIFISSGSVLLRIKAYCFIIIGTVSTAAGLHSTQTEPKKSFSYGHGHWCLGYPPTYTLIMAHPGGSTPRIQLTLRSWHTLAAPLNQMPERSDYNNPSWLPDRKPCRILPGRNYYIHIHCLGYGLRILITITVLGWIDSFQVIFFFQILNYHFDSSMLKSDWSINLPCRPRLIQRQSLYYPWVSGLEAIIPIQTSLALESVSGVVKPFPLLRLDRGRSTRALCIPNGGSRRAVPW